VCCPACEVLRGVCGLHVGARSSSCTSVSAHERTNRFPLLPLSTLPVLTAVCCFTLHPIARVSPATAAGCAWAPDSSVLLLSSTGSNYLVGVHLVGQPSKLVEQLLPVALPGVSDREL
jgi:hypothetical protein